MNVRKFLGWVTLILIVIIASFVLTWRATSRPIRGVALQTRQGERYFPLRWLSCEESACVLSLPDGDRVRVTFSIDPPDSPNLACWARASGGELGCSGRSHFYYLRGQGMRPYAVLSDRGGVLQLSDSAEMQLTLSTQIALIGLGGEQAWPIIAIIFSTIFSLYAGIVYSQASPDPASADLPDKLPLPVHLFAILLVMAFGFILSFFPLMLLFLFSGLMLD